MLNDYKIVKILGKGYNGISYLIERDNNQFVLKRQKLLSNEVKPNFKYSFWREVDFNVFVNNLSKNKQPYFMKLYEHSVNNCDYQHKPKYIPPDQKKELDIRNKSKHCLDMVIEYKGNELYGLLDKKGMSIQERYCMLIQILYAFETIREHGYLHQDIHHGNITYKKTTHPIKIYGKMLPCEYQYSLIDYGEVKHSKYCTTQKERLNHAKHLKNNEDIDQLFPQIICQYYMLYGHYNKTNRKYPDINVKNTLSLFCKEINIWNKIKKILCTTNESQKWFDTFEHKNKMIEDWDLINKIYYLFSAYNRHKFLKYIGWKIHIPNFIPSKDIIFMVENITDNKKIIKYLLNLVC
jgi:hypothetical protein